MKLRTLMILTLAGGLLVSANLARADDLDVFETHAELLRYAACAERLAERMAQHQTQRYSPRRRSTTALTWDHMTLHTNVTEMNT